RVIQEGPYDLFPDVTTLFRVVNEGNSEVVFDVQYVGLEGGGYGCLECLEGNAADGFHGIRGYQVPVYADGNSYNLPTQELGDAFEPGGPRLGVALVDIEAWKAEHPEVEYVGGAGGHTVYYNNKYLKRADEPGPP